MRCYAAPRLSTQDEGALVDTLASQRTHAASPPAVQTFAPDAPPALVAICEKAMARLPGERHRNGSELAAALEEFESNALGYSPGPRWVSGTINAATATLFLGVGLVAWLTLHHVAGFRDMGTAAWLTVIGLALAVIVSGTEWLTRGRYALSPYCLGLAFACMCGAVAGFSTGLGQTFAAAAKVAADAERFRAVAAEGLWECTAALSFGLIGAGAQFLLWALARRRVKLAELDRSSGRRAPSIASGTSSRL
jgi:hypothetical protein